MKLKLGTRGSKLAIWQAEWISSLLRQHYPGIELQIVPISTKGDRILDSPLSKIGGKGLFIKELEEALFKGEIDIAIHSAKDIPAELPEGMQISAFTCRENPLDVIISHNALKLDALPSGALIGTSSMRRKCQVLAYRRDLKVRDLRGNLDTRLRKLQQGEYDAIIVAAAGMIRLGFQDQITEYVSPEILMPAVAQGTIAIETCADREDINLCLKPLDHYHTRLAVTAERAFLKAVQGGCQIPVAAHATVSNTGIGISARISDLEGTQILEDQQSGGFGEANKIGEILAKRLLDAGGAQILEKILSSSN